jgi:glycosyltransferase involved in cell wall biosynthesis
MVHPSFFESFSIVVAEAWAHGKPTIVQGRCDVLAGQARRSGAGIPYVGFAEFEAAVDLITSDAALRRRLGDNGRRYVDPRYRWDTVIGKYEDFLGALLRPRLAG